MFEPDQPEEEVDHEEWDLDEPLDLEPAPRAPWRRPGILVVALVTVTAMALVPLYNVLGLRTVADNGLEVCGLDYCIVEEALRAAGLADTMSRLSNTFLSEDQARELAVAASSQLGIDPVGLQVVDVLERRLGGVYDPGARSILIERPARAWTVLHEVAHVVETGHGMDFQEVVIELTRWVDEGTR